MQEAHRPPLRMAVSEDPPDATVRCVLSPDGGVPAAWWKFGPREALWW
jgi:hypothetical protein